MFCNCNPETNGENKFFEYIKDKIKIIFDVGAQSSNFIYFSGEVHYFDPVNKFIENLKIKKNFNTTAEFNNFGLGSENTQYYYYPRYHFYFLFIKF